MAIKRYTADKDTIITNGYNYTLSQRGTGSNMGYADSLEVYSIYGQASSSTNGKSQELARTLVQFPINNIITDRTNNIVPDVGSVSFYLRMFNVATAFTLPQDFTLTVRALSKDWNEGTGLDMEEYTDLGNVNWIDADASTVWDNVGGDFHASPLYTASFARGYEDLEVDITPLVEEWIDGTKTNYGVILRLTGSQEALYVNPDGSGLDNGSLVENATGSTSTYYTKRFSSRSSNYFFNRPRIEARWNSSKGDDREYFYYSSSFAPLVDNLNTLYMYNYVRGRLVNLPGVGNGELNLSMYSSSNAAPTGGALNLALGGNVVANLDTQATGGYVSTGIYSCSLSMTAASTRVLALHDVWHSGGVQFFTGALYPEVMPSYQSAPTFNRITTLTNLRKQYSRKETARFRFFVRDKNWNPTLYTVSTANNPTEVIPSASFGVARIIDNLQVVPYGTGSDLSTLLSYDEKGNYFDLDVSMLEAGYAYKIKLAYYNDSIADWIEQPVEFKFRVEE
jgi:hypothetical protein